MATMVLDVLPVKLRNTKAPHPTRYLPIKQLMLLSPRRCQPKVTGEPTSLFKDGPNLRCRQLALGYYQGFQGAVT